MELVDQQRLLQIPVSAVVSCPLFLQRLCHCDKLQIMQSNLRQTIVPLDGVLIGQSAPVQLQIQLPFIGRRIVDVLFQLLHKMADGGVLRPGAAFQIPAPSGHFHHLVLRSAAAVAEAVGNELPVGNVFLPHRIRALGVI